MNDDEPKCKSCGVAWLDHLGATGTCAKLVEAQAEIERLRGELAKRPPMFFTTKDGDKFEATFGGRGVVFKGDDGELRSSREFAFCPDGRMNDCWWVWDDVDQKWRPVDACYSTREAALAARGDK